MKKTLYVLVIAHILLSAVCVHSQPPGVQNLPPPQLMLPQEDWVADINGEKIYKSEFDRNYRRYVQIELGGKEPSDINMLQRTKGNMLFMIISKVLLVQQAYKNKINFTDTQVIESFRAFAMSGRDSSLNITRFNEIMTNPQYNKVAILQSFKDNMLADEMKNRIMKNVKVTDKEALEEYRRANEKARIRFIRIGPTETMSGEEIAIATDTDYAEYYEKNKEELKEPEKSGLKYFVLNPNIDDTELKSLCDRDTRLYSAGDQANALHILIKTDNRAETTAYEMILKVKEDINAGKDFSELARNKSEDVGSGKNGGDLGFFGRGRMVAEFDSMVFSMKVGEVSDIVKTQFGYHIIKLVGYKNGTEIPFEETKGIIRARNNEVVLKTIEEKAGVIIAELKKDGNFDSIAVANGGIRNTGSFEKGSHVPGIGNDTGLNEFSFSAAIGSVYDNPVKTGNTSCVCAVDTKIASYIPGLDSHEVRNKMRRIFAKKQSVERKEKELMAFYEKNIAKYKIPEHIVLKTVFLESMKYVSDLAVDDTKIIEYYEKNKDKYALSPKYKVEESFLAYPRNATKKQKADLKKKIDRIHSDALKGKQTQAKSVVIGDESRLYRRVSALKNGEMSKPEEYNNGTGFMKLTEIIIRYKSIEEIKDYVKTDMAREFGDSAAYSRVEELIKTLEPEKFDSLSEHGDTKEITVYKGQSVADLVLNDTETMNLFELRENTAVQNPIRTVSGFSVAMVVKKSPERTPAPDEIKAQVEADMTAETTKEDEKKKKEYYEKNRERFRAPERMKLRFISFEKDSYKSKVKVTDKEAKDYYEANRDRFKAGNAHKQFNEVKNEITNILIDEKTMQLAKKEAESVISKMSSGSEFEKTGKKYGIRETDFFQQYAQWIPNLPYSPEVQTITYEAFMEKPGNLLKRVYNIGPNFYIFKASQMEKSYIAPMTDPQVNGRIYMEIKRQNENESAFKLAKEIRAMINNGAEFDTVALNTTGRVNGDTNYLTRQSLPVAGSKEREELVFGLKEGEISAPIKAEHGVYIIKMVDVTVIDRKEYEKVKNAKKEEMLNARYRETMEKWYDKIWSESRKEIRWDKL